jgi:hypothetical protein
MFNFERRTGGGWKMKCHLSEEIAISVIFVIFDDPYAANIKNEREEWKVNVHCSFPALKKNY